MFNKKPTQEQVDKATEKYLKTYLDVVTIRTYVSDIIFTLFSENEDIIFEYFSHKKNNFKNGVKKIINDMVDEIISDAEYETKISQDFIIEVVDKIKASQLDVKK